jgi:hypothetical protein
VSLTIDLSPEFERQLREEATRRGQDAAAFARAVLEEQLAAARQERARRIAALMDQWNAEDAADPDPDPVWEIAPLCLREAHVRGLRAKAGVMWMMETRTVEEIIGVVENGKIKLPPGVCLPDGLTVRVSWDERDLQAPAYDREMLTEEDVKADLRWATGKHFVE